MRSWFVAILIVTLVTLGGCAPAESPEDVVGTTTAVTGASALGTIEVSNYPLAYVVERLAGPLVELSFRAAEAPDPAYWRPSVEEIIAMQEADLVIVNGAGYEGWLKDVSLPTSRLLDTTAAVHDRLIRIEASTTHSHGLEGEHEHAGSAFTTWLDPTLLIEQARAASQGLERRWPDHAEYFADRLQDLVAELEILDAELQAATAAAAEHPVIFSHPVYQYLQQRYGLSGHSVHWEPDEAPAEGQWEELEHLMANHRAESMVWEAEPLAETSERLAEVGLGSVVVDPCSTPPSDGDLLTVMRRNTEVLRMLFASAP